MSKLGSDIYDFDHDRVGWLSLLPEDCNEMALDTGCGRGAITSLLAKRFKIVFAVDGHFESLRVAKARIDAMELRNVIFLRSDLTQELPFSDCIFDVVTLIGVLEWVPTVRMNADPRIVQLNLLKELRRVLKPGGRLVLGIENRFSISYWLGKVDHHSGMRFAPLLPRFLANVYSKALRGKPYRTYLHSFSGYSSLLREAGFKHYRFFLPLPGYVHPRILVPLDHSLKIVGYTFKQHGKSFGLKKVVKDLGINTLDWLGILQRFVDEFIIVSKK